MFPFDEEVVKRARIRRKREDVFAFFADHEGMSRWPGVKRCVLVREGSPRNGVGAVRAVSAGGLTLEEEIVEFTPPSRMAYTIIKGLPVRHRGTLTLTEDGDATLLEWRIRMTSRWPLLAPAVRLALALGLDPALAYAKKTLES